MANFGGWNPKDWAGFWDKVYDIEEAGNRSDEDLEVKLKEYKLRDKAHFDEIRSAFNDAFGDDPDFAQAGLDSRTRTIKNAMAGRMSGELKGELAPVEGATLEQWAFVMAKVAGGQAVEPFLKLAGWDKPKWDRISAEWNARMSRDTTATVATAYGQAFMATGNGPFGDAGKAAAGSMTDASKNGVAGKDPIPFAKWIEITEAQSAAAAQGMDAATVLKSYGMTPADWGTIGGFWSQKFNANAMKMIGEYTQLSQQYKDKFAKGFSADKIEF